MILRLFIDSDVGATDLTNKLDIANADKKEFMNRLINFLSSTAAGVEKGAIVEAAVNVVKASGTAALASVSAADTITIDGVVLTAVSGTPSADEFDISGTDTAAGDSLVSAIAANATLDGRVTASNSAGTVTITALDPGELGNSISLAESTSGARITLSGAALSGGANATEYTFQYGKSS